MKNKKTDILRETLIKQATDNIKDPDTLQHFLDKIDKMSEIGFINLSLGKMKDDTKHIGRIFKAQEPLFNLVTSILQVMEEANPSLFKKSVDELTDGVKFTIGREDSTLNETDTIGDVLRCIFNDAFYSMMRDARRSVDSMEGGIGTIDMLTNCSDEEYEKMSKKYASESYPEDVKDEIEKATKRLKSKAKKGGVNAEA
tara:strand:- start:1608 stop:2204 length:597 start_codon:yes stop_codon:yes gene_type:complete